MFFQNLILKIIYVTRNPRDACVSYHNHWKILEGYHGGFEAFSEAFIGDIAGYYSPFIHHVLGIKINDNEFYYKHFFVKPIATKIENFFIELQNIGISEI